MWGGQIALVLHQVGRGKAVVHLQGRDDALLHKILVTHAADPGNDFPCHDVEQVVVIELSAEGRNGFEVLKSSKNILDFKIRTIREKHQIAHAQAHATAVGEQVLDVEIFGHVVVVHLKFGDVVFHLIRPFQLAFFFQNRQGSSGKRFAVGGDGKIGEFVDGLLGIDVGYAVAFLVNHFAVFYHGDSDTGYFEFREGIGDQGIDVL